MTASRSSRRADQAFREHRGAHRPPGFGFVVFVPWLVAAVAVIAVVLLGGGLWNRNPSSDGTTSVSAGAKPKPTKPPLTGPSSPAPVTTTSAPTGEVKRELALVVLNGTPRSGLAAKAADKLRGAGWQIRSTGNHPASNAGTVVYFGRATLQATAEAVVAQLGGGSAKESADFGRERVTVVLGSDFTP